MLLSLFFYVAPWVLGIGGYLIFDAIRDGLYRRSCNRRRAEILAEMGIVED